MGLKTLPYRLFRIPAFYQSIFKSKPILQSYKFWTISVFYKISKKKRKAKNREKKKWLKAWQRVKFDFAHIVQSKLGSRKSREFKIFGPFLLKFFSKKKPENLLTEYLDKKNLRHDAVILTNLFITFKVAQVV